MQPLSYSPTEFKPIPGHREYVINEDGSMIKHISSDHYIRKPFINQCFHPVKNSSYPNGCFYVTLISRDKLRDDGSTYDSPHLACIAVHRLVALTYCPNPDPVNNIWVNHEDGNKLNNHYSNLKWGTVSYNIKHSITTGLRKIKTGKDSPLYGRKFSKATKNKMAVAKLGELHPKFKGYYITPFGTFASSGEAQRATGINSRTIYNRCKNSIKGYSFSGKH